MQELSQINRKRARSREYMRLKVAKLKLTPSDWEAYKQELYAQRRQTRVRMTPERKATQRAAYRQYANRYVAEKRRSPEAWPSMVVPQARCRARKNNVLFTITPEDVKVPPECPILRVPFVFGKRNHPHAPSIDRVRPELGYVPGNVRVISVMANRAKNDITDPEMFRRLALYIEGKI